jgi:hypothetical protein
MPDRLAESLGVYGAALLNKDTSGDAFDLGLGPERRWSGASRCGGNDDYRPGQEFIRLNHHGESIAVLLVAHALRHTNRWTSPRSTKCFHQLRDRDHLLPVRLVGF